jgi:hypothetical protein
VLSVKIVWWLWLASKIDGSWTAGPQKTNSSRAILFPGWVLGPQF